MLNITNKVALPGVSITYNKKINVIIKNDVSRGFVGKFQVPQSLTALFQDAILYDTKILNR